ncbi:MAG TPA: thioredoxin domain-containing protein [Gemmatimonadaceae bacterium]|nr:thioredoxin domain-containing protein [Gemmatimonadaceae bacterium]
MPRRFHESCLIVLLAGAIAGATACGTPRADGSGTNAARGSTTTDSGAGAVVAPIVMDSDVARADSARVEGSPSARVWLIMASDFQCPYCKEWHDETYPTIVKNYVKTGKIRLAYLNFPLLGAHPHAVAAAEAAMCAAAQGRFWQLHDALFAMQDTWAPLANPAPYFDSLAIKAGVGAAKWRHCVATNEMQRLIDSDRARSSKSGVTSTPSFFVGNQLFAGADQTITVLGPVLDAAIAKANSPAKPPGGS